MANTKEIDILNRQGYVDQMKSILATLSENKKNCAFALNGEWGSGKTFVLNMLEEQIQNDYLVIRYNAWENDFYEEPLIAILYTFANKLNETNKIKNIANGTLKNIGKRVGNSILNVIGEITANKVGINAVDLVKNTVKSLKDNKEQEQINIDFNPHANIKIIKEKIVKELNKLSEKVSIVVLVDELDRCLPEYAVKVLERLHHVFNDVENLQVILSIDKDQLNNAVAKIYNLSNIEKNKKTTNQKYERTYTDYIESYYKKFFSFEIFLNEGNFNEWKWEERIAEYKNLFTQNPLIKDVDVANFYDMIFEDFNAREKINLIDKVNLIHNLIVADGVKLDISYMYMEILLTVKQEQRIKKFEQRTYSQNYFGAVVDYNEYFELLRHNMSENMNCTNGRVFQMLNGNGYSFMLKDLWCYLWFALLIPIENSIWGISNCPNIKKYEEHFNKFSDLLKAIK